MQTVHTEYMDINEIDNPDSVSHASPASSKNRQALSPRNNQLDQSFTGTGLNKLINMEQRKQKKSETRMLSKMRQHSKTKNKQDVKRSINYDSDPESC